MFTSAVEGVGNDTLMDLELIERVATPTYLDVCLSGVYVLYHYKACTVTHVIIIISCNCHWAGTVGVHVVSHKDFPYNATGISILCVWNKLYGTSNLYFC